jgi:copper chaperone
MKQQQTLLTVEGMTCPSCVRHVDHALRDLDGVCEVEVRLREGKALVTHDPIAAPIGTMIEALREAGYDGAQAT